jgi:primosomal protein N' (replication factor Y)
MVKKFPYQSHFGAGQLVAVLTMQPLDRFLDYKAPEGGVFQGAFVTVPLGPRKVIGVVWGKGAGGYDPDKIRSIINLIDVPPMREEMQLFLSKVGDYTLTAMFSMLRLATRAPGLTDPPGMRKIYGLGHIVPDRMTPARRKVIGVLEDHNGSRFAMSELAQLAGVTSSVVKGLLAQNVLLEYETPRDLAYPFLDVAMDGKALTDDQSRVSRILRGKVAAKSYSASLLKGVTGSGKTEVYLEAVSECLAHGRQALVLLPEIALTVEFLDRVEERFGARPAEWHSGITATERRRCWRMVGQGMAQLVVGARSALYLPFQNLGLIVVDEEHDPSYKQDDGVLYNARDMAVLRASICDASVVLASATPSLESWANAKSGKYERFDLTQRFGVAELPDMKSIDLRGDELETGRWISKTLTREVFKRLERGEQSLLFLNRRGYAPVTVCRACGFQIGCEDCDARMVEHRFQGRLMCHQCGETKPIVKTCPSCGIEGKLAAIGPGIERLAEEAEMRFEGAKISVLSSDMHLTTRSLKERIISIANGEADIIIGTQLVAKGHNFPLLTCVGVIDADLGLQGSDLRAAERTFQLIRQVAGRAGRVDKKGTAFIQTLQPEHPVIQAILSGEEEKFWAAEADQRERAGVPPYGRMAGVVVSGPDLAQVSDLARYMVHNAEPLHRINAEIFGPAPAPIARVRGRHRVRILIKASKGVLIQPALTAWYASIDLPTNVRVRIDIDPQTFY